MIQIQKRGTKIPEVGAKINSGTIAVSLLLFFIIFLSACTSQGAKSLCGNKIVETGEICDGAGCPADKVCTEKCKCVSFSPPQLPA